MNKYKIHIKPIFKWFDIWIGLFIDQKKFRNPTNPNEFSGNKLYIFILPMFGFEIMYYRSYNKEGIKYDSNPTIKRLQQWDRVERNNKEIWK